MSVAYSTITSTVCPRCSTSTQSPTTKEVSYFQGASQSISQSSKTVGPVPGQASAISGGSVSSAVENTGTKSTGSSPLASHNDNSSNAAFNGSGSASTEGASPYPQQSHQQPSPYPASAPIHDSGSVGIEVASPYQQGSNHQPSPYPALVQSTGSDNYGSKGTVSPAENSEIQGNGQASVGIKESGSLGAESQPPAAAAEGHGKLSMPAAASQALTTQMVGTVTKVVTATKVPVAAAPIFSSTTNDISLASSASKPLITKTLIPVPVSPSQYTKAPGIGPYPSGNATSTYGTSASEGLSTTSTKTGSNAASSVRPTSVLFTGAARKQNSGIWAVIGVAIGAVLII